MGNNWITDRLKELRQRDRSKSQRGLAEALGLVPSGVNKVVKGDRRIQGHEVPIIARYLEWTEAEVLRHIAGHAEAAFTPNNRPALMRPLPVQVVGKVQAGYWNEAEEIPYDDQPVVYAMEDPRYKGIPHFALEVVGPSMNMLYPEGSFVVCVPLIHTGGEIPIHHGNKVIVERRNAHGAVETTVKELVLDKKGEPWLWPRRRRQ